MDAVRTTRAGSCAWLTRRLEIVFDARSVISKIACFGLLSALVAVGQAQEVPKFRQPLGNPAAAAHTVSGDQKDQAINLFHDRKESFIQNRGQWNAKGRFLAQGPDLSVWLTDAGFIADVYQTQGRARKGQAIQFAFAGGAKPQFQTSEDTGMTWEFLGRGGHPDTHRTRAYKQVVASGVYPGIDVRYYMQAGRPRFDLIVKPHANPSVVGLALKGAQDPHVDKSGDLVFKTSVATVDLGGLAAYQEVGGKRKPVTAAFKAEANGKIGFAVGNYDRSQTLVIDPVIYGTLFGGDGGWDSVEGLTTDNSNGVYLTGYTRTPEFPANFFPYTFSIIGFQNAFVAKLQGDVYNRDYAAVFGGSGIDEGKFLNVDAGGNLWVVGDSNSVDFPGYVVGTKTQYVRYDANATGGTFMIRLSNPSGSVSHTGSFAYDASAATVQSFFQPFYPGLTVTRVNQAPFDGSPAGSSTELQFTFPATDEVEVSADAVPTWPLIVTAGGQNLLPSAPSNGGVNAFLLTPGLVSPLFPSAGNAVLTASDGTQVKFAFNATGPQMIATLPAGWGLQSGLMPGVTVPATPAFNNQPWIVSLPSGVSLVSFGPDKTGVLGTEQAIPIVVESLSFSPNRSAVTGGSFLLDDYFNKITTTSVVPTILNCVMGNVNGPLSVPTPTPTPALPWNPALVVPAANLYYTLENAMVGLFQGQGINYGIAIDKPGSGDLPNGTVYLEVATANPTPFNYTLAANTPLLAVDNPALGGVTLGAVRETPGVNLLPRPTYVAGSFNFTFLMEWKTDPNLILNPEVGHETLAVLGGNTAPVTTAGFALYAPSGTTATSKVTLGLAGTSMQGIGEPNFWLQELEPGRTGGNYPYTTPLGQPVYLAAHSPGGTTVTNLAHFNAALNQLSYHLILQYDPVGQYFSIQQEGYEGDSAAALVRTRGVAFDPQGDLVVGGTVDYLGNYDTSQPGAPFVTTPGVYDAGGFNGRLLRSSPNGPRFAADMFVRVYNSANKMLASCLVGGNDRDEAAGWDYDKYTVPAEDPLAFNSPGTSPSPDQLSPELGGDVANLLGDTNPKRYIYSITRFGIGGGYVTPTFLPAMPDITTGSCIAVDSSGAIYIIGRTSSFDFPRTRNVLGGVFVGTTDFFYQTTLTKLSNDLSALEYSTNLNTNGDVYTAGIAVGPDGTAYISGNAHYRVAFPHVVLPAAPPDQNSPSGATNVPSVAGTQGAFNASGPSDYPHEQGFFIAINNTATGYVFGSWLGNAGGDSRVFGPYVDTVGDCWTFGELQEFEAYWRYPMNLSPGGTERVNYFGAISQLTGLAFKVSTDDEYNWGLNQVAYGVQDYNPPFDDGPQGPLTIAPWFDYYPLDYPATYYHIMLGNASFPNGTLEGYLNSESSGLGESKDGWAVRYRFELPVIQSLTFDRPNLAGGSGNITNATVTLSAPAPLQGSSITISLSNGAPASLSNVATETQEIITIPSGQTTATIPVYTQPVASQTSFTLTANYLGDVAVAECTLEPWLTALQIDPNTVIGGQGVTGTVLLEEPAPPSGVLVSLNVDRSAVVTLPLTVLVPSGAVSANFPIGTNGVSANVIATVTASYGGDNVTQQLLVEPAGINTFSFNPNPVDGGTPTTGTVTLNGQPGSNFNVTLSGLPAGFVATPAVLAFTAGGGGTESFNLTTPFVTKTTTITVTATRSDNKQSTNATLTVFVQAPNSISVTGANPVNSGGQSAVTVFLGAPADAGGTVVNLASSNAAASFILPSGALAQTESIVIPQGATSLVVPVQAGVVTVQTNVNFTATRGTATVSTAPNPLIVKGLAATISLASTNISAAQSTVATVTLSGAAPAGGVNVPITITDPTSGNASTAAKASPVTVTIPAGKTQGTTTITAANSVAGPTTVNVNATLSGVTSSAQLTISPIVLTQITFTPNSVPGGQNSSLTVTISSAAPAGGMTIPLTNTNPSIALVPASVFIPAGQTTSTPVNVVTKPVSRTLSAIVTETNVVSSPAGKLTITASI